MNGRRMLAGLLLGWAIVATPGYAQLFGKRTPPTPPVPLDQKVAALVKTVKEDGDENKRLAAIEDLRGLDAAAHAEIIPALMEAMLNDKKPSVRAEAAYTIGRIRPVQGGIGQALEHVRDNDASMRVRLQARGTLMSYYLGGYRSNKMEDPKQPLTPNGKEPPVAPGTGTGAAAKNVPPPVSTGQPGPSQPAPFQAGPFQSAPPVIVTAPPQGVPLLPVPTQQPPVAQQPAPLQAVPTTPQPNVPTTTLPPAPPPVVVERPGETGARPLPPGPGTATPATPAPRSEGPSLGPPPG